MEQEITPIGIAIVGYGYWSPNLIRNIKKFSAFRIIAICEKDAAKHAQIVRDHPDLKLYQHYRDAFHDTEVEAVVVGTIPSSHYRITKMALDHGKHALVEKPLALSVTHARELEKLARVKGLVLMVDHTFVYAPAVEKLRELVAQKALGDRLLTIDSVRTNLGLFQRDTNVVWDLAPHDISILLRVLGESPTHVRATAVAPITHGSLERQHDSVAFLDLFFPGGLLAHIHVSWLAPQKIRRLTLVGDRKMAVYDLLDAEGKVKIFDKCAEPAPGKQTALFSYQDGGMLVVDEPSATEDLEHMIGDFRDAILKKQTPRSHASFGVEVVEVLRAVDRSLARGGKKVKIRRIIETPDNPDHLLRRFLKKLTFLK